MKKIIVVIFLSLITISCKTKPYFKEIVSEKPVKIRSGLQKNDSLKYVLIPLEFELNLNSNDIIVASVLLYTYKKKLDYLPYNSETDKIKINISPLKEKVPKSIYIVPQKLALSPVMLNRILSKYAPDVKPDSIGINTKTLDLVPYKQFREDFPDYIEEMRKVPDTFGINIAFKGGRIEVIEEQIKW